MAAEDSQIYRDLMRFKPDDLTANGWAVKAGVSRTVWTDMRRHGNPSRRTLEKLLLAAGSSLAEFEALRIGDPAQSSRFGSASALGEAGARRWSGAPLPPIPLLATRFGGEWSGGTEGIELLEIGGDQVLGHLPRPASLAGDRDAYAVTIVGDAMWPRFRPGRRLAVSPGSPVAIGDDVLVELASNEGATTALLMELVRRTAGHVELRQFNPEATVRVATSQIAAVHKVVGELI